MNIKTDIQKLTSMVDDEVDQINGRLQTIVHAMEYIREILTAEGEVDLEKAISEIDDCIMEIGK